MERLINILLLKLSLKDKASYTEIRTYKEGKTYKKYIICIGKEKETFKGKRELVMYLYEKGGM